jgi:hypothetical protein
MMTLSPLSLSLSLSVVDLAAMEASPIGDEEASGSEYEEDEDNDDDE